MEHFISPRRLGDFKNKLQSEIIDPINDEQVLQRKHLNQLDEEVNVLYEHIEPLSWAEIKKLVQKGVGARRIPVGSQFKIGMDGANEILLDIVHHGWQKDNRLVQPDTADASPVMIGLLHYLMPTQQFDATEAFYYAEDGLSAGTYHFTLPSGYDDAHEGGSSIQFTLANAVPEGGQLMFPWVYNTNASTTKVSSYASENDYTVIETVSVEIGTGGTDLGMLHYRDAQFGTDNLNNVERVRYGSNNWNDSTIVQYLNTDATGGTWWNSTNRFDRRGNGYNKNGFMSLLDADFRAVVKELTIQTVSNNVWELDTHPDFYESDCKFWLPSAKQIFNTSEPKVTGEEVFEFYKDATNDDRIKYYLSDKTNAGYWWLRTPYPSNSTTVRRVHRDGSLSSSGADNINGVCAACAIG